QTVSSSTCSSLTTVQVQDASGNPVAFTAALNVLLNSSSNGGSFFSDPTCTTPVASVSIAKGDSAASFYFKDFTVGTPALTASATGLTSVTQAVKMICPASGSGVFCDDADLCNGRETCQSGACVAGTATACDDLDPCTADSCSAATGCLHAVNASCCRTPLIDAPSLSAAVGVPYRITPSGNATLTKGT